jgi:type II secretory ATPase GspE/PulE/Tfp pilus assembly ATPase PilB-like protein
MKNIHVLPTDKPSRLRYNLSNVLVLTKEPYRDYSKQVNQNIYITSDEEIKELP